MNKMLETMLPAVMSTLLKALPADIVKTGLDALFDVIEEKVVESDNGIDDVVVLPLVRKLRAALDVPDDDDIG